MQPRSQSLWDLPPPQPACQDNLKIITMHAKGIDKSKEGFCALIDHHDPSSLSLTETTKKGGVKTPRDWITFLLNMHGGTDRTTTTKKILP